MKLLLLTLTFGLSFTSISYSKANSTIKGDDSFFNETHLSILKQYFSDSIITELEACMYLFQSVRTDKDMSAAYEKAVGVRDKLINESYEHDPYEMMMDLGSVDSVLIGFRSDCVAECTEFNYTFFLPDLLDLAKKTKGELDNQFFELMIMAYGEYGGQAYYWMEFFERFGDYVGSSTLGDSLAFDFLKASWELSKKTDMFDDHIKAVREGCIRYMEHDSYMHSKEKVNLEIKRILSSNILSKEEIDKITAILKRNESGEEKIQYDCLHMDCDFDY